MDVEKAVLEHKSVMEGLGILALEHRFRLEIRDGLFIRGSLLVTVERCPVRPGSAAACLPACLPHHLVKGRGVKGRDHRLPPAFWAVVTLPTVPPSRAGNEEGEEEEKKTWLDCRPERSSNTGHPGKPNRS